jgi:UPF0755 protein
MRRVSLMRRVLLALCVLGVVGGLGAAAAAQWAWNRAHEPYRGFDEAERFVEIPPGAGVAEIRRRLVAAGIVRDELSLRIALWSTGRARSLQAGEYRFDQPATPFEVVERLAKGDVYLQRLTFPEGLTRMEMAAIYEERGFGPAKEFLEASSQGALVADLDPAARDLEGYLFPDTYGLPRGTTAGRRVALMLERFRQAYRPALQQAARDQGLSTRQVVTLAALVEEETAQPEERPRVAAVYRNRLQRGMAMQADPTIVYALRLAGRYDGNIRKVDLELDSPYNTYRHSGLPPGPIAAPGLASIEAALMPAPVPYLYFVSRNDGTHVFSETLTQHNANVAEYQVRYFRARRGGPAPRQGQSRRP